VELLEQLTKTVMDHERIIGGFGAKLDNIEKAVNNGLSEKLDENIKALEVFKAACASRCALKEIDDSKNWFLKMLQSSASKVLGIVIIFIILSALTSGGTWMALKAFAWKELPRQQLSIVEQGKNMQIHNYHQHILRDGRILFHTGDTNVRAYILDPNTGKYERAPYMRTEESVK
jgi:hypothetical protein